MMNVSKTKIRKNADMKAKAYSPVRNALITAVAAEQITKSANNVEII